MTFTNVANEFAKLWKYLLVSILCVVFFYFRRSYEQKKIPNIPLIPSVPIVGSLITLRNNPALTLLKWSQDYKSTIFQVKLGNKYVVVINLFDEVNLLWNKFACSNNSRPLMHTFHDVVSRDLALTIGSTPISKSCVRTKKALAVNLNHSAMDNHITSIIAQYSNLMIKNLFISNRELFGPPSCNIYNGRKFFLADIDLMPYVQYFTLASSIFLTFGINLDCYKNHAKLAKEIIHVENNIMKFRSPVGNWSDYIPLLTLIPNPIAEEMRSRREIYINYLLSLLESNLARKYHQQSIIGKLKSEDKLNEAELKSICLSLISAGLDNTPMNFNHLMGHLSHKHGARLQKRAFEELLKGSNDNLEKAWDDSAKNMDCQFVMALIHETLRYFTVLPLSLPRLTTKPITLTTKDKQCVTIPSNTILFMNAYAANHDPSVFNWPYHFLPERWLDCNGNIRENMKHFAFGAGSRKCSGASLATQELYTLTCRMILAFKILCPVGDNLMELDPFKNNLCPSAVSFEPKPFKIRLEPRVYNGSDNLYHKIIHD